MSALQVIALCGSYAIMQMGALLVWPSRKNVPVWLNFALFSTAYVLAPLVVDYGELFERETIDKLLLINIVGAVSMMVGIGMGMSLSPGKAKGGADRAFDDLRISRLLRAVLVANVVMSLCFVWMGGLPIFAEDPFLAKFFRGEYKARYDQVAIAYRLAQTVLTTLLPVVVALCVQYRSRHAVALVVWSTLLFAGALNRGLVLGAVIVVIATWCSSSRFKWLSFVVGSTVAVMLGSAIYSLIGLLGDRETSALYEIAWGAPDISDQLTFLQAFDVDQPFTFGLSLIGGMVPGNFRFNPAVFTLAIANQTNDISELASGGFRLVPPLYGYMAFSWVGAVIVPLISGVLQTLYVRRLRSRFTGDLVQRVIAVQSFLVVGTFWISFYTMSYQGLIAVLLWSWAFREQARTSRSTRLDPNVAVMDTSVPLQKGQGPSTS